MLNILLYKSKSKVEEVGDQADVFGLQKSFIPSPFIRSFLKTLTDRKIYFCANRTSIVVTVVLIIIIGIII